VLRRLASQLARLVPSRFFVRILGFLLQARAVNTPPRERLEMLFYLQNLVNNLLAGAGVDYGDGTHVKHRLMRYHDFFVDNLRPGERVLDVGCGGGQVARSIAERVEDAEVVGIDISATNIARAREVCAGANVQLLCGDAAELPAEERPFDAIVLSNILEHIERRPELLRKLFTATRANRALIRVPLYERDWTVPMRQELGIEWRLDTTHFTEYTVPQFEEEIAAAGANVERLDIRWSEIWAVVVPARV